MRKVFMIIALVMLITGCSQNKEESLPKEPYTPAVTVGEEKMEVLQGSYCWVKKCVDMIEPMQRFKESKYDVKTFDAGSSVKVVFEENPNEMTISISNVFDSSFPKPVNVVNNEFLLPKTPGVYLLNLDARWEQGSSSYVSQIQVVGDGNKNSHEPLPDAETIFLETATSLREIAWNQLSQSEKTSVYGDWRKASVNNVKWDDVPLKKVSYKPESVYKVAFTTKEDKLLGPIGIYIDPATKEVVGYDARK